MSIRNLCFLVLLPVCVGAFAQVPANFVPVPMNWNETSQSVFDLSGYLDAPAGKGGYIRVEGEHFVKPNGERFRMWGVNLMANFFMLPKEQAVKVADDFARFGFTCVRFHSVDASNLFPNRRNTLEWDAEKLDNLDFFVSELKKRGIYFSMTLNAYRIFREDDGIVDYNKFGYGKPAYYTNAAIQQRCFEFAEKFLTHKNPYTGNEYRHEPTLAWIELLNENSLIEAWAGGRLVPKENDTAQTPWKKLTPHYAEELEEMWNQWLLKENVPVEKRKQWASALGRDTDRVPISTQADWTTKCTDEHYATELRFFMEIESRYYQKMVAFLKKLGVKSLITGDADHNHGISPYPHLLAFNVGGNFIDSHNYWEHPDFGPPPKLNKHNPMVNMPLDSTVVEIARTPMKGKPFTTTELNAVFPHYYAGEHTPIFASYALFQDWDGIIWFNWGIGQLLPAQNKAEMFGNSNDPIRFSNLILAGLMFHRQDVEKAKETIVRNLTRSAALDSLRWSRNATNRPFFMKDFAKSIPLQHKVLWQLVEENDPVLQQKYPEAAPLGLIQSDTGQLTWKNADQKKGVVMIDTPATQGAVGFLGGVPESLGEITIAVDNEFASVVLTSLDGKPIREANRLLLVAHSYYRSTNFEWAEEGKVVKQMGTLPMNILPVKGTITLKNNARNVTITPLSGVGAPLGTSWNAPKNGDISLNGNQPAAWYLIEVER